MHIFNKQNHGKNVDDVQRKTQGGGGTCLQTSRIPLLVWMLCSLPVCRKVGQEGFSPLLPFARQDASYWGDVLWAKQFAASLENSLHLQVEAVNLARQSRGSSEALVFAKDLVISCPLATSAPFFLPDLWCCWMLSHCCPYLLIPAGHSHQEWVLG